MKTISLTRGLVALVDDEDYPSVAAYNWFAQKGTRTFYAARTVRDATGKKRQLYLHRVLAGHPPGLDVDHRNGNGLDNQRSNLRVATRSQNQQNRTKKADGCWSRFKGACWDKRRSVWQANIQIAGKQRHLGYFPSERLAQDAYAAAAVAEFGEYANPRVEAAE